MSLAAFIYKPPSQKIDVIHCDDDLLLVSKPAGLLSVPGKPADHHDCLESRIRHDLPDARIVHRLDMATSGIMVMAMNSRAHRHLGLQFERRHIKKKYLARVWGRVEKDEGVIDLPLRCDWPNRPLQLVDHDLGKSALTRWQVLKREVKATDVVLSPKTGRSHQLRVHMKSIGHPILGDEFYAHGEALIAASRLMLHAHSLTLFHPTGGKEYEFIDPSPF
jgi:tRNA pseudouridine32 synthase/23S rRNA pseudouridine746 synthase